MGSVSLKIGDGTARFRRAGMCSSALHLIMLVSVLATNLFALYAFKYAAPSSNPAHFAHEQQEEEENKNISLISDHVAYILRQIGDSEKKLTQIERNILGYSSVDLSKPNTPQELALFLSRHPLPLGRDSRTGITEMVSSVGHSCADSHELLSRYMSYRPALLCPDDAYLAHKLLSRRCEPLPRRRCLSRASPKPGLAPFPASLWSPKIVGPGNFDKLMWVKPRGKNDFSIDDVLGLGKGIGIRIRVGFDIGGSSANFAARMAEKGVTVVTSTLNHGVAEFVAARGLFPLQITPNQRFPFHDHVFDLVHTVHGLDDGAAGPLAPPPEWLEFLMFDVDRILRPGGFFWLDNYHCLDDKSKSTITLLIEKFGYKKLKWVVGEKADAAGVSQTGKPKVFLSAVLQKPARG